jgi:hypothetical protein
VPRPTSTEVRTRKEVRDVVYPAEPSSGIADKPRRPAHLLVPEVWASLAIAVIWLAVLFAAVFGPTS